MATYRQNELFLKDHISATVSRTENLKTYSETRLQGLSFLEKHFWSIYYRSKARIDLKICYFEFFERFFEPEPVRILSIRFYAKMFASEFSTSRLLCLTKISRLLHAEKCQNVQNRGLG